MNLLNFKNIKLLVTKVLLVVFTFTILFSFIPNEHWNNMENKNKEKNNNFDYFFNRLYFVMTTFSTAGFGDIYPVSNYAKLATMFLQLSVAIMIIDHITI